MNKPLIWASSILLAALSLQYSSVQGKSKVETAASDGPENPVLVELFTSEGCSDCPPADALLRKLDEAQPVMGANVIVLSEHVDYWNHLGWKDPYSSRASSNRQLLYSQYLNLATVYTPQMIVDGEAQFVGSDEARAISAIRKAAKGVKVPVTLNVLQRDGAFLNIHVHVDQLPPSAPEDSAKLFVAVADDMDESQVGAGENSGRSLKHIAVMRKLLPEGNATKTNRFDSDLRVNIEPGMPDRLRIVAFVQGAGPGRVLGAASARVDR
jgi:hypothetical protein